MAVTSTLYATTAANNPTTGNTWTNPTNAQGAPNATGTTAPTNSATWVNAARSTVSVALECSGYNFQSAVGASSVITAVTATIPHAETSTTVVAALTAQLYSGSTAIGAAVAITRVTSLATATVNFPTMPTYAQLADLRVRIVATRSNSTTSTTTYIDAVGLAVTYVVVPSTAPTITIGTTTQYTVPMSWGSVADATGFDVERDGVVIVTNQAGTSYTDTTRPASSDYSYRVRGVNAGGNGPWSSAVVGTTQAPTPVTRSTSFEGPSGTEVSLTNADGDDFGWMTTPVGSTFTFDDTVAAAIASGSSCAKVENTTAANIVPYRQWALGGLGHPVSYYRAYFYLPSLPNGTTDLLMTLDVEGSGAARGRIRINSANKLTVNFGPTLMTPAVMPVLTAAVLYRVEAEVNMPYGTQTLRLYEGHSTTLVAEETFTDVFLSFDSASMRIASATAANVSYYLDDVAFSNVDWIGPSAVVSSSVTGAGNLVSSSPTLAGTGSSQLAGSGSLAPAAPTLSGAGAVRISGAGSLVPAAPTLAGAAALRLSGASNLVPAASTLSGAGALRLSGAGGLISAAPTLSGAGVVRTTGAGTLQPAAPTLSSVGDVREMVAGSGAFVAGAPALSAIGTVSLIGNGALATSAPTLSGAGAISLSANGALVAASPSLSGVGQLASSGTSALIASSPSLSGSGVSSLVGQGSLTLVSPTLSGAGVISLGGAGSLTANSPILSGASIIQLSGAGALLATVPSLSGSGNSLLIGSGTLVAASPTLSGIAVSRLTGVSALTASSPSLSSTAGLLVTGSGQLISSAPILIGTEAGIVIGSGALVAASPLLSGTGIVPLTGSGVLVSKEPTISGSGFVSAPAIAGVSALSPTPATLLGSGIIRMVGAGSLVAQPRTLSGTSVLYLAGSGILFVWPSLSGSVQLRLAGSGDIISIGGVLAGSAAVYDSSFEVPPENRFVVEEDLRDFEVAPSPENIAQVEWHNRSFRVEIENRTLIALEDSTMRARKSPNAKLPFLFDWSTWLANEEDSASSVDWIVPEGLVKETSPPSTLSDGVTVVWLSGGTKGIVYRVICRITTVAGRIDERTLHLRISSR